MNAGSILSDTLIAGSPMVLNATPRRVLDEHDIELLSTVSKRLMGNSAAKAFPDIMSFAFWCRNGHLRRLSREREDLANNKGRGLSLHVAPSNVPINFAFSWAFALLAGNACVVRIPTKPFPQVDLVCKAIDSAMRDFRDERSAFVSYDSSSDFTAALSSVADIRVIWGGDATASQIRTLPAKPYCIDVAFTDRYSIAILDASVVAQLNGAGLERLASDFYNDTYLMDQNACSSPMTVAWLNTNDKGKALFWEALRKHAFKNYNLQGAVVTDKYVQLCRDAMDGCITERIDFDGLLSVLRLDVSTLSPESLGNYRGKGGFFYEFDVNDFSEIAPLISRPCQTVTYFGCDPIAIQKQVLESQLRGIDRIVPVGKAMDIDIVWDGMDLLSMMSRKVDVR